MSPALGAGPPPGLSGRDWLESDLLRLARGAWEPDDLLREEPDDLVRGDLDPDDFRLSAIPTATIAPAPGPRAARPRPARPVSSHNWIKSDQDYIVNFREPLEREA